MQRTEIIHAEQIRLLYANAPAGFVATVLNVVLLSLLQWQVMAPPRLVSWLASMLALTTLRAVLVWRFQRRAPAPPAIGQWGTFFGLGALGAGFGWGSAGVWLFPSASLTHQVFLVFVLEGMIVGAVGLLAARMGVFLSFACPAAAPLIVHLLAQDNTTSRTMGGMVALLTMVFTFTAWKLHCAIRTSLHLCIDNTDVVVAVTAEKARVEHLNTELTAEITEHQRAAAALRTAHEALAVRVQERTAELATTLEQLQIEMVERQRLTEELRQVQKMEAVGRLAGGVAHDFNNILAAMIGYTELATYNISAANPAWHQLQEVLRAGQRAKALVHQILTFSRRTAQAHAPVQLPPLVEEALALLRASLPSSIEIRQHIDPEVGAVLADPTQLHQVIINLCANAEYAMRQTGGLLDVRLEAVKVDTALAAQHPTLHLGPHVQLTVRDTGQGMPPEVVEHIYDPFFTTKAAGEGTGIGLSVVHEIVVNHGGTITVESQVDYGTTFTIYLPCIPWDMAGEVQEEEPLPCRQERLLFVDDEPALVHLGQAVLTQLGYDVTTCTSGVEALAAFQAAPQHFDLVITDYTMPQMTGDALTRALRGLRPDIPIILETGFSHTIDAEQAAALGIDAFLLKPWTVRELARTIAQVLAQHRA